MRPPARALHVALCTGHGVSEGGGRRARPSVCAGERRTGRTSPADPTRRRSARRSPAGPRAPADSPGSWRPTPPAGPSRCGRTAPGTSARGSGRHRGLQRGKHTHTRSQQRGHRHPHTPGRRPVRGEQSPAAGGARARGRGPQPGAMRVSQNPGRRVLTENKAGCRVQHATQGKLS